MRNATDIVVRVVVAWKRANFSRYKGEFDSRRREEIFNLLWKFEFGREIKIRVWSTARYVYIYIYDVEKGSCWFSMSGGEE